VACGVTLVVNRERKNWSGAAAVPHIHPRPDQPHTLDRAEQL